MGVIEPGDQEKDMKPRLDFNSGDILNVVFEE